MGEEMNPNRVDPSGEVSYSEINAMVRLGQRVELEAYLRQFLSDLRNIAEEDMTLARARFISLVSILVLSTMEIGAPPSVESTIAHAAHESDSAASADDLMSVASKFLSHATVCAQPNANRMAIQMVERVKQIVAERYGDNLSDEAIASEMCLSRSHFRFLFREVAGMPFKRYVTEYRLNIARKLLEASTLSVKEVCHKVGYSDSSSFYRAYRAMHGVAPTAHRVASV
jgi:AraC-like DNA-binding protein